MTDRKCPHKGRQIPLGFHVLLFLLLCALLTGCAPSPRSPDYTPPEAIGDKAPALNASRKTLDKLKTFRGAFLFGKKIRSFTECGETDELWVIDKTGGTLQPARGLLAIPPNKPMFVVVRGTRAKAPVKGLGKDYAGTLIMKELIHASNPNESLGCRDPHHDYAYKAQGNEPGWTITVSTDEIAFHSINTTPLSFPAASLMRNGETTHIETSSEHHELTLEMTEGLCLDMMSGEQFGWSARAILDGTRYTGCAKQGSQK